MADEDQWDVQLASGVRRALAETLPKSAAFAAHEFIAGPLAENPYRVGSQLGPPFEKYHRARRGEYRIRYRIDEAARKVFVVDVDHRRDAYKV